jgi:hypothetical protein
MALGADLVCVAFFAIVMILGPRFYALSGVDWMRWCSGLNLGMGIVVVVAGMFQWKHKPACTISGMLLGALSIYFSTVTTSPFGD